MPGPAVCDCFNETQIKTQLIINSILYLVVKILKFNTTLIFGHSPFNVQDYMSFFCPPQTDLYCSPTLAQTLHRIITMLVELTIDASAMIITVHL